MRTEEIIHAEAIKTGESARLEVLEIFYTPKEIARIYPKSNLPTLVPQKPSTVKRWFKMGYIKTCKVNGKTMVRHSDLPF